MLEQGGGAPAVLTILYLEVCSRIGLPLQATILEQGHYAVLWPKNKPLLLAGQEVVIDVYSEGALFLMAEVRLCLDAVQYGTELHQGKSKYILAQGWGSVIPVRLMCHGVL